MAEKGSNLLKDQELRERYGIGPNDRIVDGKVVPEDPAVISERHQRIMLEAGGGRDPRDITAYEVMAPWYNHVQRTPPHKVGEKLKAAEVDVPKGMDRDAYIADLVNIRVLQPVYADKGGDKGKGEGEGVQAPQSGAQSLPETTPGNQPGRGAAEGLVDAGTEPKKG